MQVADTGTGAVRRTVPLPAGSQFIGWYDPTHLLTKAHVTDRGPRRPPLQIIDLDGRVTRTVPLPASPTLTDDGGWLANGATLLGPAAGLPPHPATPVF